MITGGLRTHADFVKALALGADAIAVSNAAMQAIGCLGMRACNTDNCPVGIATQKPGLRQRLVIDDAAQRLTRFLQATVELMTVLARACGHTHLDRAVPRRPHHVRPRDASPRRHPLRRAAPHDRPQRIRHGPTETNWHKILEPDELDEGRVTTVSVGMPLVRRHQTRGRLRLPRQRLPAPGWAARRGLDRERLAALPVARLRLLADHR